MKRRHAVEDHAEGKIAEWEVVSSKGSLQEGKTQEDATNEKELCETCRLTT
jgi:hypothetical protein